MTMRSGMGARRSSIRAWVVACLAVACLAGAGGAAAQTTPAARAEIDRLLDRLVASGCQFERNGTWHDASEAKAHLLRKLAYLEGKVAVRSAEQFIAQVATGSSTTGADYTVRCGKAPPIASKAWLTAELAALRSGTAPGPAAPK
jgi:hypothetical protein